MHMDWKFMERVHKVFANFFVKGPWGCDSFWENAPPIWGVCCIFISKFFENFRGRVHFCFSSVTKVHLNLQFFLSSLFFSVSLCLSVSMSLCLSVFLSLSFCLSLSLSLSPFLNMTIKGFSVLTIFGKNELLCKSVEEKFVKMQIFFENWKKERPL